MVAEEDRAHDVHGRPTPDGCNVERHKQSSQRLPTMDKSCRKCPRWDGKKPSLGKPHSIKILPAQKSTAFMDSLDVALITKGALFDQAKSHRPKSRIMKTLSTRHFTHETVCPHLGDFAYCILRLRSPQEYISSYPYGCRINSDHVILAVHCITV